MFGVYKNYDGKYAIVQDISEDKKYFHKFDLSYKKIDFALQKAEKITKEMYTNFVNFQGDEIIFNFVNMGLINPEG